MRRAAKRDIAEAGIVAALRAVGAFVYLHDRPVDLSVRYRGVWHWLEVKTPGNEDHHAKERREQREFIALHDIPVVTTPTEALVAIGACKLPGERRDRDPSEYVPRGTPEKP